jgi:hypothetical protein
MTPNERLQNAVTDLIGHTNVLSSIDWNDLSRDGSDAAKDALTSIQQALQLAFPALKASRKQLFQLAPGEQPGTNA